MTSPANVYILSTGSELSCGHSRDTNAPHIASRLTELGFSIVGFGTLPDDPSILTREILHTVERVDISVLILTGGLGPTEDDYTVDILAKIYGCPVIEDLQALRKLEFFRKRIQKHLDTPTARKQIRVPVEAKVFPNRIGLAPGFALEYILDDRTCLIIALPGVPKEMEAMFSRNAVPYLKNRFPQISSQKRKRCQFYLYDMGESSFQDRFFGYAQKSPLRSPQKDRFSLSPDFRWGVTSQDGFLRIFLESDDSDLLSMLVKTAQEEFPEHFLEDEASSLVHDLCVKHNLLLGLAESCTGGLASKILTDRSGSSQYFRGGIVSYSNQVKSSVLGIKASILEQEGAVSSTCAEAMALSAQKLLNTDFALSTTGIAGPGGGSSEKPVGLVYIGICDSKGNTGVHKLNHLLDREGVRLSSVSMAFFYLCRFMKKQLAER